MKKFMSIALIFCLFTSLLTSCTGKPDETKGSESETDALVNEDTTDATEAAPKDLFEHMDGYFEVKDNTIKTYANEESTPKNPKYNAAFSNQEMLNNDFVAELTINLTNVSSGGGIFFNASKNDSGEYGGFAFLISRTEVTLSRIKVDANGNTTTEEMGRRAVEEVKQKTDALLRVERIGNTLRLYYLDDVSETLVPWPEIEITDADRKTSTGLGIVDNGMGAIFKNLTVYGADQIFDNGLSGVGTQYTNPIYNNGHTADPQIIEWEGKYYCYSTSGSGGFRVLESSDMINWVDKGYCLQGGWNTAAGRFWAPEVVEKDGKFYMIFSNADILGIAVADSPLGPFVHNEKPLLYSAIDGHIFFDDDGRVYLYYVAWPGNVYGIYGCEIEPDLSKVKSSTITLLLKPEVSWEKQKEAITEGPSMIKHNGTYYLTYSGSHYTDMHYAVGYATSDSPLGTYKRYTGNPLLSYTKYVNGPGHHSFITIGNEMFIVYHAHSSTLEFTERNICIDRIRFAPTKSGVDRIEVYGPTRSPQNAPKVNN